MNFAETKLPGAFIVDLEPRGDERGFFSRTWCEREFADAGLSATISQANVSLSRDKGTVRGMHLQLPPAAEVKLVRCIRGAIYDVIVDLRPSSPTFCEWVGVELTSENRRALYVPEGFAHGFQTLTNDAEVFYQVSEFYTPEYETGFRYNDPRFGIEWPQEVTVVTEKDSSWPDFEPIQALESVPVPGGIS
ncbi:MAG: dTDP-4-dehydrorhamnose 3,5-epimerase [Longimicrobiales bacterium]